MLYLSELNQLEATEKRTAVAPQPETMHFVPTAMVSVFNPMALVLLLKSSSFSNVSKQISLILYIPCKG